jgi:MFS family permease
MATGRGYLSGILIDVTPLRTSPDFARLFVSQMFTMWCRQIVIVAMPFQVYLITHSSLWVGIMGMVQAVAIVTTGLYGGALIDRYERRRIQAVGKSIAAAASLALTAGALLPVTPLWVVIALAGAGTAAYSLDQSARAATVPRLVSNEQLPSALSLGMVLTRSGAIAGPAIGGVVIAALGLPWAYAIDVAGFVPAVIFVSLMRPQAPSSEHVVLGLRAPLEALNYVRRSPILISTFVADLNATIFGVPTAVFPALALNVFKVGPTGLGLLYSAEGVGAFLATLFSGWVRRIERQGVVIIGAIAVWGLAITAFGLFGQFRLVGLFFLALSGAGDMVSAVFRQTILQSAVPDRLRGRMSAFNSMVVTTGPRLGDLEAGAVAALVNPIFSVVSGGILTVIGIAVIAAMTPTLRNYRRPASEDAEPVAVDAPAAPVSESTT